VPTVTGDARPTTVDGTIPTAPMIVRGQVIASDLTEFQGRGDTLTFRAPDPRLHLSSLPLSSPGELRDLYALSFDDILDYLEELGSRLDVRTNMHMQWARDLTYATSPHPKILVDNDFDGAGLMFDRDQVRERADKTVGLAYLNGWVATTLRDKTTLSVRAFGARGVHIIPGQSPLSAARTIITAAFTRSDCIIKTPSNNPFAPVAIAWTMCEMAPDHPITKHIAVGYWRGGDEAVERSLYQPHLIDKIIAWGGFASVKHVTRYIQPGLELISLDPKNSCSIVDGVVLDQEKAMREAALRIAVDVGALNQVGCSSSRLVYVITGEQDSVERLSSLGRLVYEELMGLPERMSTKAKWYDPELRSNVDALRLQDDWYTVIGGGDDEGCVIVSHLPDPVGFAGLLSGRTVNIVPVKSLDDAMPRFNAYTQTVGVYPESLKQRLVDIAPFYGVQRFVSLGYAGHHTWSGPHDGIELERRMCKWVVDQRSEPVPLAYAGSGNRAIHPAHVPGSAEAVRAAAS